VCGASPAGAAGNPYRFHRSVAACAAAERNRCESCLADGPCAPITGTGDGDAECAQLAADEGRGYSLICVNLALAIDAVASCAARRASSCPRDIDASESMSTLDANAGFVDDPACAAPLDACLARIYGKRPDFPGGGSSPPPSDSAGCGDSCSGDSSYDDSGCDDSSCDADVGCEVDSSDDGCSDSGESSGCEEPGDPGADPGTTDSCEGDSEDSCGSEDNSGCSDSGESDCGSSADGGGDCESGEGGGDCEGGDSGSDCESGGGAGGGGDCNVAGTRGHASRAGRAGRAGASLPVAVAWALLPLPFAIIVRRRAERRRARAAWDADSARAQSEVAP
jgi:hypothetical protein